MVSLKSLLLGATALTTPVLAAPAAAASPQDPGSGGSVVISPQDPEGGGSVIIFPLPSPRPSAPFGGIGQIRTRSKDGPDYVDLGCLTKEGRWTVNESQCGVFKADRSRPEGYGIDIWTLKSKAGPCQTWFARFKCEKGADSTEFGVSATLNLTFSRNSLAKIRKASLRCIQGEEIVLTLFLVNV